MTAASLVHDTSRPETPLQREDRCALERLAELRGKGKELTESEKMEKDALVQELVTKSWLEDGGVTGFNADHDRRDLVERVHRELRDEFGSETASKKLLIERCTAAYSMSMSYERLFKVLKYEFNEKGQMVYRGFMHQVMKEIRKGVESSNDQIIRFVQALNDINRPALTVKATNAFFAQNQQVNQGATSSKDLEDDPSVVGHYAPHS